MSIANASTAARWTSCAWALVLLSWLPVACGADAKPAGETAPRLILTEAMDLARTTPPARFGVAWGKPLALVRLAATMRLHGMPAEALAVLRDARQCNAEGKVEECRDQIVIELCRLFALAGRIDEAEALATTARFRDYFMPARFMIARAAADNGDRATAERVIRQPCFIVADAGAKAGSDMWRRAAVHLAVGLDLLDSARQIADAITTPLWRSAALGDLAAAQAKAGNPSQAIALAAGVPDACLAVIELGRVADAIARRDPHASLDAIVHALRKAAPRVSNAAERDYGLGVAVSRLAAAGRRVAAATIAQSIEDPIAQVRAQCQLLAPERIAALEKAVAACPEADRPLLEEYAAIACAQHGLAGPAAGAAGRIRDPWQRCRAQSIAARILADRGGKAESAALVQAAAETAELIESPAWQAHAHVRVALAAERADLAQFAGRQFTVARADLGRVNDAEWQPGLVAVVAEAQAALRRGPALREFAAAVLNAEPSAPTRDRLLPVLAAAGEVNLVTAECRRAKPRDGGAQRAVIYRLAQRGAFAQARTMADEQPPARRVEALCDIALAQLPRSAPPAQTGTPAARPVGVALNGGWASWFPRLERMGIPWELMPCNMPHELGATGLADRYLAIGYPGAGGHEVYTGVAGMENLRDHLYAGGGYLGICAGQYLATRQHYVESDSINMGCPSGSPHQVQMRKRQLVGLGLPPVVTIARRNGGILIPRPGCDVLGWYDTIERHAALVAQDYGYGRVVALSPHPEGSGGLDPRDRLCINALHWITQGLP